MPANPPVKEIIRGLYAIADTTYSRPQEIGKTSEALIKGGARVIQLRAKDLPGGEMLKAAAALRSLTLKTGTVFIVNDRIDIAVLSGADGVHLGQDDIPIEDCRRLLGSSVIIGVSTHNLMEAKRAEDSGADYISFGPIFPTKTKKDASTPKGLQGLREIAGEISLPITAIGGITVENVEAVLRAGADAAAIISDILMAPEISAKTAFIVSKINGFRSKYPIKA